MNLSNMKFESYASVVCVFLVFFFKWLLLLAIILQFRVIHALKNNIQSATLFKNFFIAWVAEIIFCVGAACVNPNFSVSMGFNTFYIGSIALTISAPMLLIFTRRFTKEIVAVTNERLFWGIFIFAIIEVFMGVLWELSYLWYWLSIAHSLMHLTTTIINMSILSVVVITALLTFAVVRVEEIRGANDSANASSQS